MLMPTRVWDPLYGRIELTKYEYKLISLPEVQRLRGIRMCNINSLLVTGASEISRFEHTIGVLRLMKEWISSHQISEIVANDLIAAAVLHDMQTGPFGHSLQYVLEDNEVEGNFIHDDITHGRKNYYHQDLVANASFSGRPFGAEALLGDRWRSVGNLIKGNGPLGPLIAGTMDLDNIDNVVRLAYHVGVAKSGDATIALGLARDLDIKDGELNFSIAAVEKIHRWQEIRKDLYELLLLDWAEFSAKAMFTRAIEIAIAKDLLGANSWVHTDSELLAILERNGIGDAQAVSDLIKRLRVGDLYIPISLLKSPSIGQYSSLCSTEVKSRIESSIVEFAKSTLGLNIRIIVHLILDKGKTCRAVQVRLKENGKLTSIGVNSENLLVGVFLSKAGLSERNMASLKQQIYNILKEEGLQEMSEIEDPMGKPICIDTPLTQLDLL